MRSPKLQILIDNNANKLAGYQLKKYMISVLGEAWRKKLPGLCWATVAASAGAKGSSFPCVRIMDIWNVRMRRTR